VAARGRKPLEVELRLRERIESFYLSGMRPVEIRDALASAQNVAPVELSVRQVQAYLRSIRGGWAETLDPAARDAERAELVAQLKDAIRTAASASARYREDSVGVGYANTRIKALNSLARLQGFFEPARADRGTRVWSDAHQYEGLPPAEQTASLRHLLDIMEETP
jgi:hypothetical protein